MFADLGKDGRRAKTTPVSQHTDRTAWLSCPPVLANGRYGAHLGLMETETNRVMSRPTARFAKCALNSDPN